METKLEILVLEDTHYMTALIALDKAGANPKIVGDLEEFLKEVKDPKYHGAIIDINFPRKQGEQAQPIGYEVGEAAKNHALPYVHLTAGKDHGYNVARILLEKDVTIGIVPEKDTEQAWIQAYKTLKEIAPHMEATQKAKARYKKHVGKAFEEKQKR